MATGCDGDREANRCANEVGRRLRNIDLERDVEPVGAIGARAASDARDGAHRGNAQVWLGDIDPHTDLHEVGIFDRESTIDMHCRVGHRHEFAGGRVAMADKYLRDAYRGNGNEHDFVGW